MISVKVANCAMLLLLPSLSFAQVSNMLRKLVDNKVRSLADLVVQLRRDPTRTFLCEEAQEFLAAETRKEFRSAWANLVPRASSSSSAK